MTVYSLTFLLFSWIETKPPKRTCEGVASRIISKMKSEDYWMPDNLTITNYLRETGLLLSVKGDNPFKARAYIKGAQAIESLQTDIGKNRSTSMLLVDAMELAD